MTEYTSTIKTNEDVEHEGITLVQREDGFYAVPGGLYVTNKGYAKEVARRLNYEFSMPAPPMTKLSKKVVTRLSGASSDTSIMGA